MIQAGIVGATGYVGQELVRLLVNHPESEVSIITSRTYQGMNYDRVYGNYTNIYTTECIEEDIKNMADKVDVLFIALPHGLASKLVDKALADKTVIIDLGADFRLKDKSVYEAWYNTSHHHPELLDEAVYGLCEWNRQAVKETNLIANPGCYTTCSLLSLLPLLKESVIDPESIIVDAKSAASGAGRGLNLATHFTECNESIKAYKIASHRHTPEIEQELSLRASKDIKILFTPHLIPMNRGILITAYTKLTQSFDDEAIKKIYHHYYQKEYFVRLLDEGIYPETKWVKGSNFCDINFVLDKRTNTLIITAAIDNLMKGAAGQAVQNMNIRFGLDEKMGLNDVPMFP